MLKNILDGEAPSSVFKQMIVDNPALTNIDLSNSLANEFDNLNSQAAQLVWHWQRPGKQQGLSDENLDALLLNFFQEAGYLVR
ncbi:hypothetical protein GCM10011613_33070 [Cellvibrio zantedeschiae]|uniref:Uncharacterized protein n=1 Tax=Cellvibrio zantedeschiae TaxID=1237077 RepID=A0ABQ3B987_9GAMM|nr:hypothetical protein [Cellvibrio zantedeschiae]GGY85328.1 hypothetical protein GCM10011613_33070 [Cellvibrio zantedeschiae]